MTTKSTPSKLEDGLVDGLILGALLVKGKEAAYIAYAEEIGLSRQRLDSIFREVRSRMRSAAIAWEVKGSIRP